MAQNYALMQDEDDLTDINKANQTTPWTRKHNIGHIVMLARAGKRLIMKRIDIRLLTNSSKTINTKNIIIIVNRQRID